MAMTDPARATRVSSDATEDRGPITPDRQRWRYPSIWRLDLLETYLRDPVGRHLGCNTWVPARPNGFTSFRSRCTVAWLVFRGRADALTWPEDQRS